MPALSFPVQGTQIVRWVEASNDCYTPGMQFRSTVLLTGLILMGILLAQALPAPFVVTTIHQHTLFLFLGTIVAILWNRFPILVIVLICSWLAPGRAIQVAHGPLL